MGIYDRDYYREEAGRRLIFGRRAGAASACAWLIGINVAVFLLEIVLTRPDGDHPLIAWFSLDPARVIGRLEIWRLLTSAFLHAPRSIWHIAFNMLFLWWMGRDLERLYGRFDFLWFYLTAAVGSAIVYVIASFSILPALHGPGFHARAAIGASGAVMAVVTLSAFHFPRRRILIWFILPVPIWLFVALLVWDDVTGLTHAGSRIAHGAHLGGVLVGALYRFVDLRPSRLRARVRAVVARHAAGRQPRPDAGAAERGEAVRERVDALLAKISRQGMASLTEEERRFLREASQHYRGR